MQEMQEMQVQSLGQEDSLRRKWQPTLVFLPGESRGQRSLVGYSPWSCKESDTTEHACRHTHTWKPSSMFGWMIRLRWYEGGWVEEDKYDEFRIYFVSRHCARNLSPSLVLITLWGGWRNYSAPWTILCLLPTPSCILAGVIPTRDKLESVKVRIPIC